MIQMHSRIRTPRVSRFLKLIDEFVCTFIHSMRKDCTTSCLHFNVYSHTHSTSMFTSAFLIPKGRGPVFSIMLYVQH